MSTTRLRTIVDAVTTVAILLTCAVVVWLALSSGGATRPQRQPPLPKEPVSLQGAQVLGNPNAKVAVIEYSDLQCPYCGTFARDVWPAIATQYINPGRVLFAFRHYPLERLHPVAFRAAEATECAALQGRFWEMKASFFNDQAGLRDRDLKDWARSLGLDDAQFGECLVRGSMASSVRDDMANGILFDVYSTPSFLIGPLDSDGRVRVTHRLKGQQSLNALKSVLESLLAGHE